MPCSSLNFWDLAVKVQSFGNEMVINQKGPINIKFPEINECIVCHLPFIKVVNASSETDRALIYFGNQVYVDVKNKLKSVIQFNYNITILQYIYIIKVTQNKIININYCFVRLSFNLKILFS